MTILKFISAFTAGLIASAAIAGDPVNVNNATAESIAESLDGVGLSKARAIVAYREIHGSFNHPDELVAVKGIGISTVDRNRDNIRLNAQPSENTKTR